MYVRFVCVLCVYVCVCVCVYVCVVCICVYVCVHVLHIMIVFMYLDPFHVHIGWIGEMIRGNETRREDGGVAYMI